jgi:integrase
MPSVYTFADLLDLYLTDYLPRLAPGSQRQYRHVLSVARVAFGNVPLQDLTPALLRAWRLTLQQRLAPGTVRTWLDILSAPLTVAVDDLEWLARNPLTKVARPPAPVERVRFLTAQERAALLTACRQSGNAALYPIVLIALTTGARKNEIRYLRGLDVDLRRGLLRLARTKNGTGRPVPMPQLTVETLRPWWERQQQGGDLAWVFPGPKGRGPAAISNAWYRACQRAGLKDFRFHDLRHTAASYLAMSGASLREIADILGHKSLKVTMKYAHLTTAYTAGVIERMASQFLPDLGGAPDATDHDPLV